jgi:pyridinium-3,5-biscarboxylic acid mononucleotide synthase
MPTNRSTIEELLQRVIGGQQGVGEATATLLAMVERSPHSAPSIAASLALEDGSTNPQATRWRGVEDATLDLGRRARCGWPEVIYGEGKSPALIARIARELLLHEDEILVTRIAADAVEEAIGNEPAIHWRHDPLGRTLRIARRPIVDPADREIPLDGATRVAVITAGSTDRPVAREAIETLHWMGLPTLDLQDCGVAGPQRLVAHLPAIRTCRVAIVIAGMEGALPSVVAGHVPFPVIAVPTSVGYGAALGGLTPLLAMLTSCAANVAVVNIDAGFKAAYLAALIATPPAR